MELSPLQIDFYLASDLVIQNPLHPDALIQYFMIEEDEDNGIVNDKLLIDYELPLRKIKVNEYWFWDCSNSIFDVKNIQQDTIKKRLFIEGIQKDNVNIVGTYYGHRMTSFERLSVDVVTFFVYGDKLKVEKILNRMVNRNLGMLRAKGFGLIKNIKISDIEMEYCFIKDNVLLRDIPINFDNNNLDIFNNPDITIKKGRYRPPYYDLVSYDKDKNILICAGSKIDSREYNFTILGE